MTRLPTPGGDDGNWGNILNDYLAVSLDTDGTLKSSAIAAKADDSAVVHNTASETVSGTKTFTTAPVVPANSFPESAITNLQSDLNAKMPLSQAAGGDLSGTLPNPTVAKVGGVAISGTPTAGQVLTASGPAAAAWAPDPAGSAVQSAQTSPTTTLYVQPTTPVSPNVGDLWVPTAQMVPSDIGAEASANKGVANGYMGLDSGGLGAAPPQLHAAAHMPGATDDLYVFGGNQSTLAIENMPYFIFQSNQVPVSGDIYFMNFTAARTQTVSNLALCTANIGTPNVTAVRLQICLANIDGSFTPVAETANDTTLLTAASFTVQHRALSGARGLATSYAITRGVRYSYALIAVGATIPPCYALSGNPMSGANQIVGSSNSKRMSAQFTGQSDGSASTYASGSITISLGTYFWVASY